METHATFRAVEQPSLKSTRACIGLPMLATLEHAVEDDQELLHAGGKGNFLGFAGNQHPWVKLADHRVVSAGDQRPI